MFMGEHQHTIDEKGRLIMPVRFREGLGESFVVTKGLDNCLWAYAAAEWSALEAKMKALPFTQANARAFVRFFFSGANECLLDRQGRVLIPNNLREYARLARDVVVIGVSSRVEIWAREEWDRYLQQAESSYEQLAEEIADFNL